MVNSLINQLSMLKDCEEYVILCFSSDEGSKAKKAQVICSSESTKQFTDNHQLCLKWSEYSSLQSSSNNSLIENTESRHRKYRQSIRDQLKSSQNIAQNKIKVGLDNETDSHEITNFKLSCDQCSFRTSYKHNLTEHVKLVHESDSLECDKCAYTAQNPEALLEHQTNCSGADNSDIICEFCSQKFIHAYMRKKHMGTHFTNGQWQCPTCLKWVPKNRVKIHRLQHSEVREHKCTQCEFSFKRADHLKAHLRVHEKKKVPCKLCSRQFSRHADLKYHMLEHEGIKPYMCEFCGKLFHRQSLLNRHSKIHLKLTDFKPPQESETVAVETQPSIILPDPQSITQQSIAVYQQDNEQQISGFTFQSSLQQYQQFSNTIQTPYYPSTIVLQPDHQIGQNAADFQQNSQQLDIVHYQTDSSGHL